VVQPLENANPEKQKARIEFAGGIPKSDDAVAAMLGVSAS